MRTMVWRWSALAAEVRPLPTGDNSFKCISEMRAVRHHCVDNLLGNVGATVPVSERGPKICRRGSTEVNNRFGGNCFACHVTARPEFDFVCEQDHGCNPVPSTRDMFGALQRTDPRCRNRAPVSEADAQALRQLGERVQSLTGGKPTN